MKQFKDSTQYKEIKEEILKYLHLDHQANFECHSDSIATYSVEFGLHHLEFNIIAEDEIFLCEMTIEELLDLKRIKFFELAVYFDHNRTNLIVYNFEDLVQVKLKNIGKDE